MIIIEENKNSLEVFAYLENMLDCEFIFFEFCEMIFYISKKFSLLKHIKDASSEILRHLHDLIEMKDNLNKNNEKNIYYYPRLEHHRTYERIIEVKRQKQEDDKLRRTELKRFELERKLMSNEDLSVMPEPQRQESQSDDSENDF
jgi:hypothetical protein